MATEIADRVREMGARARLAARRLAESSGAARAAALAAMAGELERARPELRAANAADLEDARKAGLAGPLLKRLEVSDKVFRYIDHINVHGSGHTDGIVTGDLAAAEAFVRGVDSASVMVNASTRLSGGGDYGLGAVVGISTDKLHARGPVGPRELTSYKWVAYGEGHLRE